MKSAKIAKIELTAATTRSTTTTSKKERRRRNRNKRFIEKTIATRILEIRQ